MRWEVKGSGGWSAGSTGGVHSKEGKLQLVFYCNTGGNPENWALGNTESEEGSQAVYLYLLF